MNAAPQRVLLLSLGGTITMTGDGGQNVTPTLGAADLVGAASGSVVVETRDVRALPGAHVGYDDLVEVASIIRSASADGYAGVVVVQGTDTIEETAFALDLLVTRAMPVVVTGAMRNASARGADGPANVADAVAVARAPSSRDMGVQVVLGSEIHAASLVRKAHTSAPHAFESWPGAIGAVHEGRVWHAVRVAAAPSPLPGAVAPGGPWPSVEMITALLGASSKPVDRLIESPPDAVLVEGFGGGHVPPSWVEPLSALAATRPVVLCSRTRSGPILESTYGFAGSERDLIARGLIPSRAVGASRSAVALVFVLAAGGDVDDVRRFFGC